MFIRSLQYDPSWRPALNPLPVLPKNPDYTTTLEMTDLSFYEFALLTEEDVKSLALARKKSSDLDPLPSSILPDEWKNALVHPLLKKPGLGTGKHEELPPNKQLTVYF